MLFSYSIDMIKHMDILRSIKCHIEDSLFLILGMQSGLLQTNSIKKNIFAREKHGLCQGINT